ncbi:ECF RNA polymerase sigma factor SigK [Nocardia cyriacigeorgica]|uniref:ECF RNA polymerase sigma factor SigK n=1 Tax=Nocardia cyriacigeorgica TaxID=135487 RepID=UPI0013D56183|nr:ECF RNA polymerase sigma factor SigK [Nocardia cyriacigeorgica]MBF6437041.1 ECF RNA polymerase sigma factor SigK [Nocardia cyriacigeorgica]MBF6452610.1 ECF RNA polymerase sigma factor SigK [Nocardia cyriacigeorgica]MBF6480105.1 ECF RNA polymerase sigma factor SigK [Nocardia cyriacigeorgica]MBF6549779.1 ECF RNA polymerase sigma factor SigK [Nocardia cyriacigeorgica]NEW26143.1 sigma-70 family RNA polymerase sigma factor [Nocardia cyriacigeorgica]
MTRDTGPIPFIGPIAPDDLAGEQAACPVRHGNGEVRARLDGLLKSTATGDREAFTRFYRETSPRVFGLALRVLRSPAAAEETTQEVFLQVWSSADRYDPAMSSPIGWLMMITHRRAVDRVRSESSAAGRDAVYGHTHLGRDHDIVAETVGQRLDEQAVRDCLDTLTSTQREAVALAYYSGRTYREVADHLASPLPTVKSRIRDGLKRLQDCLTGVTR